MIRDKSEYLILSWEQVNIMCNDLIEQIIHSKINYKKGFTSQNVEDQVVAAIIASKLGVSICNNGVLFSLEEKENTEVTFYKNKEGSSKNIPFVSYKEEQKIVYPWKPL